MLLCHYVASVNQALWKKTTVPNQMSPMSVLCTSSFKSQIPTPKLRVATGATPCRKRYHRKRKVSIAEYIPPRNDRVTKRCVTTYLTGHRCFSLPSALMLRFLSSYFFVIIFLNFLSVNFSFSISQLLLLGFLLQFTWHSEIRIPRLHSTVDFLTSKPSTQFRTHRIFPPQRKVALVVRDFDLKLL